MANCFLRSIRILVAGNADDQQRLLYKRKTTAEQFNMRISIKKTQSMVISKHRIRCKLAVDKVIINQVARLEWKVSSGRNPKARHRLEKQNDECKQQDETL